MSAAPGSGAANHAELVELMHGLGRRAVAAAQALALAPTSTKNAALGIAAGALRADKSTILAENGRDLVAARRDAMTGPLLERLALRPWHWRLRTSRPFPIPSARSRRPGSGPTALRYHGWSCLWASSA